MSTKVSPLNKQAMAQDEPQGLQLGLQTAQLKRKQAIIINVCRIVLFVVLIIVWQLISGTLVDPLFISSPQAVIVQLISWSNDGTLWFNTSITLQETLLGLVFGIVAGVVAGFFLGIQRVLGKILDPFIVALYSIPKVALAPLFIVWFGIGIEMKVILAAVTVFFLVFFNTLAGIREVDQDHIDAVYLMGGNQWDIVTRVIVPSATSYTLTGLRIAIPYALIGAVIAELVAANRGLGFLINDSASTFNTAGVFAALVVLTIISGLLSAIVDFIDHKTSRWKAGISTGSTVIPK